VTKAFLLALALSICCVTTGQKPKGTGESTYPPPVTFTVEQDHQNMMDQLGIKALRPGAKWERERPESREL
jgi:hypothetical protein